MDVARTKIEEYRGLDLRTSRLFMSPQSARTSNNFDYQRRGASRVRAGYARAQATSVDIVQVTFSESDDFNRANSASLGASWTDRGDFDFGIASNECEIPAGATINDVLGAEFAGGSFNDDQYSRIKFVSGFTAEDAMGVMVRSDATNAYAAYWFIQDGTTFWLRLAKVTWPNTIAIIRQQKHTFSQNDILTLSVVGTTLEVQQNGIPVMTGSDGTISTGEPGIIGLKGDPGSTVSVDDWEGGDTRTKIITSVPVAPSAIQTFERDDDQAITVITHGGTMTSFDVGTPEWTS